MPNLRFALLVLAVLLLGGGLFWWYGPGQPDPVYSLISRLPEPAADMVKVAVRKIGYQLPERGAGRTEAKEWQGSQSSVSGGDGGVPAPELIDASGHDDKLEADAGSDTHAAAGQAGRPPDAKSSRSASGLPLKLDSRVGFKSVPRIRSALFSESRRLVIFFPLDRFDLTSESRDALAQLSAALGDAQPLFTLRIDGHCDDTGDDVYNQRLSEQRAFAALDYLKALGLNAESTAIRGFGERIPAVSADDAGSRARNRRAEIWVEWVESRSTEATSTSVPLSD